MSRLRALAAFGAYLAASLVYFAPRVAEHPARTVVGSGQDVQIFVWSFAWWPHAILHGENPLTTHAIWAPDGYNLAWTTSMPGLALVFSPLTYAFGAVASFDVAAILIPALDAFAAFLLCRHVTKSTWPSLAGGYLFGFSSYVLGGTLDHIHTTAVFLVPLAALLVLRFLEGSLGRRAFGGTFAALLIAQFLLSIEILFTLTLALAGSVVLAFLVAPRMRSRLRSLLAPLLGAYAIAVAVTSPFAYYLATGTGFRPVTGSESYVADLLNYVVPTRVSWLGGTWAHGLAANFPGNDVERGAYLGLPVLLIIMWFAAQRLRSPSGRFLIIGFLVAVIASLGSWLTLNGEQVVSLPWRWIASLPFLVNTTPARFSLYASLAAAVMVAIWAASPRVPTAIRVALPILAAVAIAPNMTLDGWARTLHVPSMFTSGLERSCFRSGDTLLVFPFGSSGDSMIWQADAGFRFRLAGGYIAFVPPPSYTTPAIQHLTTADYPSELTTAAVLTLARLKSVDAIVVDARLAKPYERVLRPLGPPQAAGGVLVYRLTPGSCRQA